jgi:parallel beta-helix repeat protein
MNAVGPLFGIPGMSGVLGSFESVLILDNEITENGLKPLALGLGISIRNSTDIRIKRNLIQSNFVGISLIDSQRLGIEENTITDNRVIGIEDLTSSGVLIENNRVERQGGNGIQLAGGIYNISKNQIRNNGGRGLILESSASPFFNARVSWLTDNLITANNVDDLKADKETVILKCTGNTIHDYATTEELRKQCEGK